MNKFPIKLIHKRYELLPLADIVKEKADSERNALGFLAATAYQEAAINEKLIVAIDPLDKSYK